MPLNYNGTERVGEIDVWSFADEQGNPFRTDDPMLALELGAPVGSETPAPVAQAPGLLPPPPGPGSSGQPNFGAFTGAPDLGSGTRGTVTMPGPMAGGSVPAGPPDMRLAMADAVPAGADPRFYTPPVATDAPAFDLGAAAAQQAGPTTTRQQTPSFDANEALDFGDEQSAQPTEQSAPQSEAAAQGGGSMSPVLQGLVADAPQRYRRVGASPGGWIDTERKFKGDPETFGTLVQEQRRLAEREVENSELRMNLDQERMANESIDLKLQNLKREEEIEQQRVVISQRQEHKRQGLEKIAARNQEISEMKVDAKRLFRDDPGGLIVAAIATGLGAFGAALTGGKNEAGEMIQNAIRRDIEEQRREIEEARLENDKADNALQRLLDEGMDPRFAEKQLELMQQTYAATFMKTEELQKQMQYLGIDTSDTIIKIGQQAVANEAALAEMIGAEAAQKYRLPSAGGLVENPNYFSQRASHIGDVVRVGEATGEIEPAAVRVEREKQQAAAASPDRALFWRGKPAGQARSDKEGPELRKRLGQMSNLMNALDEIDRLATNWSSLSPEDRASASNKISDVRLVVKDLYEMGAIQAPDVPFIEALVQNPNEIGTMESSARTRIRSMKENVVRTRNSVYDSQGITDPEVLGAN